SAMPRPTSAQRCAVFACPIICGITTTGTPKYRLSITLFMPPWVTKRLVFWSTSVVSHKPRRRLKMLSLSTSRGSVFSDESILVLEEWGNHLETVEDATGDGVFWKDRHRTWRSASVIIIGGSIKDPGVYCRSPVFIRNR